MGRSKFMAAAVCALLSVSPASDVNAQTTESQAAFMKMDQKLAASPNDPSVLKEHAEVATWNGDYQTASDSYRRLLEITPENDEVFLALARVEGWQGNLDNAAEFYALYTSKYTNDAKAYLDYAYNEFWRGNFAKALELADDYRAAGGDDAQYYEARARFLAGGSYSDQALMITDDLLNANPDNKHAQYSRVVALNNAKRLPEAIDALGRLQAMPDEDGKTAELARVVTTQLRPQIRGDVSYASDSDDIDIFTTELVGQYAVNPGLFLRAGALDGFLTADNGSGLDAISGAERVDHYGLWAGGSYQVNPDLWLHAGAGTHDTDATNAMFVYDARAEFRPADEWLMNFSVDRDFHAVSPRALSLDIARTDAQATATWRPNLEYTIDMQGGYADFSDGNARWNVALAPRKQILRTEDYNLDLGLSGRWFSFDDDLANGYYDPQNYRQFLLTSYSYLKLSDNDGISFIVAPGVHKDEDMDSYKFSGNFAVEGTFGLYEDWMMKARAGWVNNAGISSDTYQRGELGLSLTRRF